MQTLHGISFRLSAILDDVTGNFTEPVEFETRSAPPDAPLSPKLCSKGKAAISLKWNVRYYSRGHLPIILVMCLLFSQLVLVIM